MNNKIIQIRLLKKFINLCNNNKIWYIASGRFLLDVIEFSRLNSTNDISVSMTIKSYEKFKNLFVDKVNDSTINYNYSNIHPKFYLKKKIY